MTPDPSLEPLERADLRVLTDRGAQEDGLVVAFSDRHGGVSETPFDTLNLSTREGDPDAAVDENRRRVAAAAGFDPGSLRFVRQVHGADVVEADEDVPPGTCGDVLVARRAGAALGVFTADCAPIALAGGRGVAVVHAGWRGLVAGAIERGVEAVEADRAWIGPCIHSCCYEVGPDVVDAFESRRLPVADSWHVDPGQAAATILRRLGIDALAMTGDCTSCDLRYFSYRRDGRTGRQGAFVALLG